MVSGREFLNGSVRGIKLGKRQNILAFIPGFSKNFLGRVTSILKVVCLEYFFIKIKGNFYFK